MEIEPYRELSTFLKLLQTAMLEHNPDKPVEIMDFQRTFETPLDKAKSLINDFCEAEYRQGADFDDLHNVGLAFTTLTDDELPIQVTADLVDFKITYEFDGEVYNTEQYDNIEDMIENGLTGLDFSDLVSVPDDVIDRHKSKDEQTVELMLMSFHFIDSLEREQTVQAEKEPELAPVVDEIGSDNAEVDAPAPEATAPDKGENFTITDDALGEGGAKAKFRANVDAIKTLKTLEREKRSATAEEKETLSKYVGWGALAKAFDKNDEKWAAEYKELSELLTPQEYAQARSTVNDAFYTSPTVIDGIYEALANFGFEGGNVLEPAMGIGNFFGRMPEDMQSHSQLYGVEIDSLSGRIAQALYPDADIVIQGFEQNRFQNSCFDVAVGNVPFGELGFRDTVHDTTKLHDFFFAEALDKLKNGGIMAFVTSAGTHAELCKYHSTSYRHTVCRRQAEHP